MRKNGDASAPDPATHCQLAAFEAGSASTSVSRNAFAPVDHQILDQEGGGDHPHPVVHVTMAPELAHAGIDDRVTGLATLPFFQKIRRRPPRKGVELGIPVLRFQVGKMKQQVVGEVPPDHFLAEMDDVLGGEAPGKPACRMPDPGRRDFAHRQMRREHRRVRPGREVAQAPIAGKAVFDKRIEPLERAGFAGLPNLGKFGRPVGFGRKQGPAVERLAVGPGRRCVEGGRCGCGLAWLA